MADNTQRIGWIGMGRMGYPMAERLLKAGHDVSIWNRTRAKAEPLAKSGGKIVDKLADLAGCDVVFSITIFCPRCFSVAAASARMPMSVPPPGGHGTISVTGRVGNCCACAIPASATIAAATSMTRFIPSLPVSQTGIFRLSLQRMIPKSGHRFSDKIMRQEGTLPNDGQPRNGGHLWRIGS